MNNLFPPFVGFLYSLLAFIISFILVVGIKAIFIAVKSRFIKKPPVASVTVKRKKRKPPTAIRSIEINPEEIDRIYVKKSS